jgi:hypothetical protein
VEADCAACRPDVVIEISDGPEIRMLRLEFHMRRRRRAMILASSSSVRVTSSREVSLFGGVPASHVSRVVSQFVENAKPKML